MNIVFPFRLLLDFHSFIRIILETHLWWFFFLNRNYLLRVVFGLFHENSFNELFVFGGLVFNLCFGGDLNAETADFWDALRSGIADTLAPRRILIIVYIWVTKEWLTAHRIHWGQLRVESTWLCLTNITCSKHLNIELRGACWWAKGAKLFKHVLSISQYCNVIYWNVLAQIQIKVFDQHQLAQVRWLYSFMHDAALLFRWIWWSWLRDWIDWVVKHLLVVNLWHRELLFG